MLVFLSCIAFAFSVLPFAGQPFSGSQAAIADTDESVVCHQVYVPFTRVVGTPESSVVTPGTTLVGVGVVANREASGPRVEFTQWLKDC